MKLCKTTNYTQFQRSAENRALIPSKHKRLVESMKRYGFLEEFPIVCQRNGGSKLIVKDGQHRLSIAETLGIPVYWCMESSEWDVAIVNSTSKIWVPRDYAERYARQGNVNYQQGLEFMDLHKIPIGLSFALLAGTTTFSNVTTAFLDGTYKVKDRGWADAVAAIYVPAVALSRHCRNARFIEACMAACRVQGFDPARLIHSLNRCRDKLAAYSTREAYLDMLETIYNFGRKQLFPLKNEAIMAMRARNAVPNKHAKPHKAA